MSGTQTNAFTPLDGVPGDVSGAAEICENEMWKTVVLCQGGGEMQWTTENTVVACRELGHPAAGIYICPHTYLQDSIVCLSLQPRLEHIMIRL